MRHPATSTGERSILRLKTPAPTNTTAALKPIRPLRVTTPRHAAGAARVAAAHARAASGIEAQARAESGIERSLARLHGADGVLFRV